MASLNQIFFGPPGTGKTYATIEATLEILDPFYLAAHRKDRSTLKKRFDELSDAGDVRFVTFHQSFSYEDFVEGLRAESSDDGQLRYSVVPGVFKDLCSAKQTTFRKFEIGDKYGTGYKVIFTSEDVVELKKPKGNHLEIGMRMLRGLANAVLSNRISTADLRDGSWDEKLSDSTFDPFLVNGYKNFLPSMVDHMLGGQTGGLFEPVSESQPTGAKVLIIDEINRGNVSRVFGELITLIEPTKRAGAEEALEVTLPYSKERFSIPGNVHLIGTMNTADRSLASLDIALRRRFTFKEVPPNPALLDEVEVEGVPIDELLDVMNQRIAALLDRDHCLGHAYFMPLKSEPSLERLEQIFREQILPLLQEYFFEDWQRIQWVLNDQRKTAENRFLLQPSQDFNVLFGESVTVNKSNERWELNSAAFKNIEAYLGIIDHMTTVDLEAKRYGAKEGRHGDLVVRQSDSGTIEVSRNGVVEKPTKPLLRDLAETLGIAQLTRNGMAMNTRSLGRKVIDTLIERQG
jgi:5-methylcytosine-specific restriction protein B